MAPHLTRVAFRAGDVVSEPQRKIASVYFPETVTLCFRVGSRTDRQPAVGVTGPEGMTGWPVLMGATCSHLIGVIEMHGGTALAVPVARMLEACSISESLRASLLRYADNFMMQMAATIGANAADSMERRIARWILMLHDRNESDTLDLTHDHIASALHVRRASVTDCLHVLEGDQVIRCTRGKLMVRDRKRLQEIAGSSYGSVEARYAMEIGPFGKGCGQVLNA